MSPKLSVVTVSRNDDHGGKLLYRMQLFINGLAIQCERHRLEAELVLVEWNPPSDRPRLRDVLRWPNPDALPIRIIEVPAAVHSRLRNADRLPVFQMIGKNVGILRAHAPFILASNIDILFSDELVSFLASAPLEASRLYRVDRYDLPPELPETEWGTLMDWCKNNVIRICKRDRTIDLKAKQFERIPTTGKIPPAVNTLALKLFRGRARALIPGRLRNVWARQVKRPGVPNLHTNACGDFTLMSRDNWFGLRGYAEFEMFSIHLDSLLLHTAYYGGITEEYLADPMRIYHIEHSHGWLSDENPSPRESRETRRADHQLPEIPHLSFRQIDEWTREMQLTGAPKIFNTKNWGLAQEDLPDMSPY